MKEVSCIFFILLSLKLVTGFTETIEDVKVFTVATEENDGYERYIRSARTNGIQVETLGLGSEWKGGDMSKPGGGFKINLLREALKPFQNNNNTIVMFTDSYDVIFTTGVGEIVKKFKATEAKILFSAEHFCWPDDKLRGDYPAVPPLASRFLNSGMFIGYAPYVYEMIKTPVKDTDDDQFYFTKLYLDQDKRAHLSMQLDHKSEIFQNLNGAADDVKLDINLDTEEGVLQNINFLTTPSVIHGNGPSKVNLNSFANYLAGTFQNKKCVICEENTVVLRENNLPTVSIAVFVEKAVPFFEEFLDKILAINYPKEKINFFIHSNIAYHDELAKKYVNNYGKEYLSAKLVTSSDKIDERSARKLSVQQAQQKKSDYLLFVDADAHIDDPELLRDLLSYNRSFISPVLSRYNELWSNFWGALSDSSFYARSHDYVDIVKGNIRGMWNVPYVSSCFLIRKSAFKKLNFDHKLFDADMALCEHLRNEGIFMNIVNLKDYGHLVVSDDFDIKRTSPDFYMLASNQKDWEERYIHPEYIQHLSPNFTHLQPCPDVYWFPIGTETFCKDMIAIMEAYGKWSDGSNKDERLQGGYEAVPTRDIHMNQVGLEEQWLKFLKIYIRPLQELAFTGYYHNPPNSLMNFVVKYKPDEQPSLRPHHDSSTYTINIALNRAGIDYEGGGCHFLRYNCSVTNTKIGWLLMHPGRLTHFHEGLKVTKGVRYIMISFVDP